MELGINFIAAFVGVGGFLLGYDVGIISGVLAMDSFKDVFTFDDWQKVSRAQCMLLRLCGSGPGALPVPALPPGVAPVCPCVRAPRLRRATAPLGECRA
jgi:hypothetical protein